jgi:hypothetical protein
LGIREGGAGPHPEVRTGNRGQEETAGRLKPPKLPPEGVWGLGSRPEMLLTSLVNVPEGIFKFDAETVVSAKVNESLAFVESWLENSSSIFNSI